MGRGTKHAEDDRTATDAGADSRLERVAYPLSAALVLACAFLLAAFPAVSDDLFMHLAVGRRFFETGSFADPDPWLFSLPDYHRHWIDVAYWGTHLAITKLHALGGFELLVLAKALLVVAGAAAPLWLARRLGWRSFATPLVLLVALWAACDRFIERGSLVSDCLGPWVLALVAAELARPSRMRWLLPPLILVWTNFHPGVVVGLGFVGAAALVEARAWKRWLPLVLACCAASLLHPDGPRHLAWAFESALRASSGTGAFRAHNMEMMPTFSKAHADEREVRLFLGLLIFAWLATAYAFTQRARPWYALIVLAALTLLGVSAVRYVTTASMALPVVVVHVLAAARAKTSTPARAPRWTAWAAAGVAIAAAGLGLSVAASGYRPSSGERHVGLGLNRANYPFGAGEFLRATPHGGGVFNEHHWGAFLAWLWDGSPKVFFHGYVLDEEFYGEHYVAVNRSVADFDRIVAQHDLGAFLLQRMPVSAQSGPLLHRLLLTRPDWHLVYWDSTAMVFLRDRPENAAAIREHEYRWLDPFRPDRLARGMKENPDGVLAEAKRLLRADPGEAGVREFVRRQFRLDPDALAR